MTGRTTPAEPNSSSQAPVAARSGAGSAEPAEGSPAEAIGDPRIEAEVERLRDAENLSPSQQVAEYEAVHRVLQDTLATIDDA